MRSSTPGSGPASSPGSLPPPPESASPEDMSSEDMSSAGAALDGTAPGGVPGAGAEAGGVVGSDAQQAPGTATAPGSSAATWTDVVALPSGRTYDLHTTARGTRPRPLVVLLHAYAHNAAAMAEISGATAFADGHGFALAYGHAVDGAWNAGTCCAGTNGVDDVAYLRDLVADAARRTPVDRGRVYVWGYSNGGMMAARAVCEAPDVFAAAGVVAGHLLVPCDRTPIRMMHIHGVDDTTVPWRGGWSDYVDVTFPDARTESARVTTSSTVLGVPWAGAHAWPWWATGKLWEFSDQPAATRGGQVP